MNFLDYGWGRELCELEKRWKDSFPEEAIYSSNKNASTSVANIIDLAKAAYQAREIRSAIEHLKNETASNPHYQDDNHQEVEFFGWFKRWYWLKNDLLGDDLQAYLPALGLVSRWIEGSLKPEDEAASIEYIRDNQWGDVEYDS